MFVIRTAWFDELRPIYPSRHHIPYPVFTIDSVAPKTTTAADITEAALRSFDHAVSPRAKELLQAAVRHLHAFAVEVNLTTNELIKLAEILTAAGQISDASRHEFLLMSDVIGLTKVVDEPSDAIGRV